MSLLAVAILFELKGENRIIIRRRRRNGDHLRYVNFPIFSKSRTLSGLLNTCIYLKSSKTLEYWVFGAPERTRIEFWRKYVRLYCMGGHFVSA